MVTLTTLAANSEAPQPQPGFHQAGAWLFYVTHRGQCYVVRDEGGIVQLTPATLGDQDDPDLNAVADAADILAERCVAGVYHDGGYYYYAARGDVWMFYGAARRPVRVPCVPPRAAAVHEAPDDITAAIQALEIAE